MGEGAQRVVLAQTLPGTYEVLVSAFGSDSVDYRVVRAPPTTAADAHR